MNNNECALSYNFSCEELKALESLFRGRKDIVPKTLYNFSRAVQSKIYDCMSIGEVEETYKYESD